MKLGKRLLAFLLAMTMVLSNLPVSVMAEEIQELTAETTAEIVTETTEVPTSEASTEAPAETGTPTEQPEETLSPEPTAAVETEAPTEAPEETSAPAETEPAAEEPTEEALLEEVAADEEAMDAAEEHAPFLTYLQLEDSGNGWYPSSGGHLRSYSIGVNQQAHHIYYLNEWDGSDYAPRAVQVFSNHNDLVLTQDLTAAEGYEEYADYLYTVTVNDWELGNAQVCYEDDTTYVTMDVDTSLPEATFHWDLPCNKNTYIQGWHDLTPGVENTFYFRFESDYWTLDNVWMDADPSVASVSATREPGIYAVTLQPGYDASEYPRVHYSAYDETDPEMTMSSSLSLACRYSGAPEPYLSFRWLDNWGEGWVEQAERGTETGMGAIWPDFAVHHTYSPIFYLNTWNGETWDETPVALEDLDYDETVMTIERIQDLGEYIADGETNAEYFLRLTSLGWNNISEISCNGVGLYFDSTLGYMSFHSTDACTTEDALSEVWLDLDAEKTVFYFRFDGSNDDVYNIVYDLTGTPRAESCWGDAVTVEPVDAGIGYPVRDAIYRITVPSSIDGREGMESIRMVCDVVDNYGNSGTRDWSIDCSWHSKAPYLTFGWLRNDGEGWYEHYEEYGDDVNGVGQDFNIRKGEEVYHIYYLHTYDAQNDVWNVEPLNGSDPYYIWYDNDCLNLQKMDPSEIRGDQENGDCFYRVNGVGWSQDTGISITGNSPDENGDYVQICELPVTTNLGSYSLHSDADCSTDNFLSYWQMSSEAGECAAYFRFEDDYWELTNVQPAPGHEYRADVTEISDNLYKFTMTDEFANELKWSNGQNFEYVVCVQAKDDPNHTEEWWDGIWSYSIDPYLSLRGLYNEGDGWRVHWDSEGREFGVCPGDEMLQSYWMNVWNEETREFDFWPVEVYTNDGFLNLEKIPMEEAAADEPYGDYFYRVTSTEWARDGELYCYDEDGRKYTIPVNTHIPEQSFHSASSCTTGNYMSQWKVDPFAKENVAYVRFESDYWELDSISLASFVNGMAKVSKVREGIYKVTLNKEFVYKAVDGGHDFALNLNLVAKDGSGNTEYRGVGIWCYADLGQPEAVMHFRTDSNGEGDTYEIYEGNKILRWYFAGYDEENPGYYWNYPEVVTSLPKGVTYNLASNKLTLNKVSLSQLTVDYLSDSDLTLELTGANTITSEDRVAVYFEEGINVTVTGRGTLYVKAINSEDNVRWDGSPYSYPAWRMSSGSLTISDSVKVTAEVAGTALYDEWYGDEEYSEYIGTFQAHLNAMSLWDVDVTLKGKASLTTVVPKDAMDDGPRTEEGPREDCSHYEGGYTGLNDFRSLRVEGGTLTTSTLRLSNASFYQSGGTVTINGLGGIYSDWQYNDETGEEYLWDHYHYNGIRTEGESRIDILGGVLNVNVKPTEAQRDLDTYFHGIETNDRCVLNIGGGTVNINGAYEGNAFMINGDTDVTVSGGTINANGVGNEATREIRDIVFMDLTPSARAYFLGGTINTKWSSLLLGGKVVYDGTKLNGYGTIVQMDSAPWYDEMEDVQHDGGFLMKSGTIKLDAGALIANGYVEMTGGKLDLPRTFMVVENDFRFYGGDIVIDYNGTNYNDYDERPPALTINGMMEVGQDDQEAGSAKLTINNKTGSHAICLGGGEDWEGNAFGGKLFIYDGGSVAVDAVIPASEREADGWYISVLGDWKASVVVFGGSLTVDAENIDCAMDICGNYVQHDGTVNLKAHGKEGYKLGMAVKKTFIQNGGTLNVTGTYGMDLGWNEEERVPEDMLQINGGTLNVNAALYGVNLSNPMDINSGDVNVNISGYVSGDHLLAQGIRVLSDSAMPGTAELTISGGNVTVEMCGPRKGYVYRSFSILGGDSNVNILGGNIRFIGGNGLYSECTDLAMGLYLAEDMVVYSMDGPTKLELLNYNAFDANGYTFYSKGFEEDNQAGNIYTMDNVEEAYNTVIVSSSCGEETAWELDGKTLVIQGSGSITSYDERYAAPWTALSDFITNVEIGENVTYVGSTAFAGLKKLTRVTFQGNAPGVNAEAFAGVTATVYYPANDATWTDVAYNNYGGTLKWLLDVDTVQIVDVESSAEYLLSGGKLTLEAVLDAEGEGLDIQWTLAPESKSYASLSVKNGIATIAAKTVTQAQTIMVYANISGSENKYRVELPVYAKAKSVHIFYDDVEFTGKKITFDYSENTVLDLMAQLNPNDLAYEVEAEHLASLVTWKSSNESIATVSEDGKVTFEKFGEVKITATAVDGSKRSASVTLSPYDRYEGALKVTLSEKTGILEQPAVSGIQVGDTVKLVVTANGTEIDASELNFKITAGDTYVTVDENGVVSADAVSKKITVQVSLKEDMQNRTASVGLKTIALAPVSITLNPKDDQDGSVSSDGYIEQDGFVDYGENGGLNLFVTSGDKQIFTLTTDGFNPIGEVATKGKIKWTSSNSKLVSVKEQSDGTVTLTVAKNAKGDCVIKGVSTANANAVAEIKVSVRNFTPSLAKTSVTLNTQKEDGVDIQVNQTAGNAVTGVDLKIYSKADKDYIMSDIDNIYSAFYDKESGIVTISANEKQSNGTVKAQLVLYTEHLEPKTVNVSIKVSNSVPKVTVKQTRKLNTTELTGLITVTARDAQIENVELVECDFVILNPNAADGIYEVAVKDEAGYANDLNGILKVTMAGYNEAEYNIKLSAESKTYTLSLNTYLEEAEASATVALKEGAAVDAIYVLDSDKKTEELDEDFAASYEDGKLTVAYVDDADETGMTGSVKAQARVTNEDGRIGYVNLTIKAVNKAPAVTVKTVKKLNLSDAYGDAYGLMSVTSKNGEVLGIELEEKINYSVDAGTDDNGYFVITYDGAGSVVKGKMYVTVDGYRGSYPVNVTIGTEKVKDKAVLGATTLTVYRNLPNAYVTTTLDSYWNSTEITEVEITGSDIFNVTYENGEINVELAGEMPAAGKSYKYTIKTKTAEATLANVTLTVKVAAAPTVKLKTSTARLKLSKLDTAVEIPVTAVDVEPYGAMYFEEINNGDIFSKGEVLLSYEDGVLTASLAEHCTKENTKTGNRTIYLTPVYDGLEPEQQVKLGRLKLTVNIAR